MYACAYKAEYVARKLVQFTFVHSYIHTSTLQHTRNNLRYQKQSRLQQHNRKKKTNNKLILRRLKTMAETKQNFSKRVIIQATQHNLQQHHYIEISSSNPSWQWRWLFKLSMSK